VEGGSKPSQLDLTKENKDLYWAFPEAGELIPVLGALFDVEGN
jgi:hypothetical protein